jgi:dolichol-phosphate mannosyltransferase
MAAILAGWEYSTGDLTINMASDLQDPPFQIIEMIREWKEGYEIVVSYRKTHKTSFAKKITSKLFYKLMFPSIPPGGFDVALIDRKPLNVINSMKERNRFYQHDILDIGFKLKYIPYDKLERKIGVSQYNFLKRFKNFYSSFFNVSYLPIRILTISGFVIFLIGIIYSTSIVYSYFFLELPFQGWAPIMIAILLLGGMIMLMIGLLGEYIWRILDEIKSRPKYIIDEIL